ncbi:permease prefix domain 1-containing protein [Microbacterium rhizomatis]|uniref:DUF4153 domain-containing protein n=1 Tax=Microbacterium rhizomatis TaxID=1631477 RepID=A0A5J5IZ38_9MICO|nr:permease prefix domain 1-containing protein [Microbacterium rhizomatis]KAA9107631.1 hypothetical protein F6B43_09205 [Microbacterium rhizomatis]
MSSPDDLENQISTWRSFLSRRDAIAANDVAELEAHLRDQIDDLSHAGLAGDEAFIVAVKRMGSVDALSREFATEHSERLWKQLVLGEPADRRSESVRPRSALVLAIAFGVAAALAVKLPVLLGAGGVPPTSNGVVEFYACNAALLVLPFLAAYFAVRRRVRIVPLAVVATVFAVTAVVVNVYPFTANAATELLVAVHAPVALWLTVGIVYAGGDWRSGRARMDFIRFTGEWFVYFVLIALGGGVLCLVTVAVFQAVGVNAGLFVSDWILPCGAAGAVVIAAWLVEAKQAVIENIAPVLTKLFTPLFTLLLLALIVAGLVQQNVIDAQRDLLISFDLVLLVVVALLLYAISARDALAPPSWFERLQLLMVCSAIVVDLIVLVAMMGRIGTYGFSANKVASLGLNLILLINLAWSAWRLFGFVRGRAPFGRLESWQTGYLPVYFGWAMLVVIVFPPAFGFA